MGCICKRNVGFVSHPQFAYLMVIACVTDLCKKLAMYLVKQFYLQYQPLQGDMFEQALHLHIIVAVSYSYKIVGNTHIKQCFSFSDGIGLDDWFGAT